jgi:subtilisin family serine protease
MVVKANRGPRRFDVVDEAAGIVWAVDHGARIVNLSLGGQLTARVERDAIDYAVSKGVLLVAAAGNNHREGDPPEYPAALLQPVGSNGGPGLGLSVGASTRAGARAAFSNAGSTVTLAAPGVHVLGAVAQASNMGFQAAALPGSTAGAYGYGSGTSYAAPQVAGAAALVWAANPALTAAEVADVLRRSASGRGTWNPDTGYGVLDVANAVALAGTGL